MTRQLSKFLLLPVVLGLSVVSGFAQSASVKASWGELRRLPAGTQVRVELTGGRRLVGQFQSATDDSLSIAASSGQQSLERPMVEKVSSKAASHRIRNSLLGLAIGTGGGFAIGAAADASCKNICFDHLGKEVFTPLGALFGVVIGALMPTGRYHDIYRIK